MEALSKTVSRAFKGTYDSPFGKQYQFDVVMEDGTTGQFSSSKESPSSFTPGQAQKYTVELKEGVSKAGKPYSFKVLKPVKENNFKPGGGFKKSPFTDAIILAQSSYSKSIELVIAGKIEMSQLQQAAEKLMSQQIESAIKFKDQLKEELDK